jgi:hypothetical protein
MNEWHANYIIIEDAPDRLVLKDIGPWNKFLTVTNDIEWVVSQVAPRLNGRILLYHDSEDRPDRIIVRNGKFAGFQAWRE